MKREIDLRPVEFTRLQRAPQRRLVLGLIALSMAALLFLLIVLAEHNLFLLSSELDNLHRSNINLAAEAEPLFQIEAWITELEKKASLQSSLQSLSRPWSSYLRQIEAVLPEAFHLAAFVTDDTGQLTIYGSGPFLPQIAAYSQALNNLDFIACSSVTKIDLEEAGSYHFIVQASLVNSTFRRPEDQAENTPFLPQDIDRENEGEQDSIGL